MRDSTDAPQPDWPPPRLWTMPPRAGVPGGRLSVGRRPSWFWRIREDISPSLGIALASASLTAPLVVWILLVANHAVNPIFLPNPLDVLGSLRDLLTDCRHGRGLVEVADWLAASISALAAPAAAPA